MARSKIVTARKDYPQFGIVKGQSHYHWVLKTGPRSSREFRQANAPKRSQLTTSDFLSQLYDIFDDQIAKVEDAEGIREAAQAIRDLGQEQQEKFDNMPEGLQQGPTGQLLEGRATGCEGAADTVEQAADELDSQIESLDGEKADHEALLEKWAAYDAARDEFDDLDEEDQAEATEPDEPDEARPEDRDFDEERQELVNDAISTASDAEADCEG